MTEKSKISQKISTESYKGVRDFYPEDMYIQNYIFETWKKVVESFGYVEYGASLLEPSDLYRAKSGEEIVNEQTYTFTDRGEREVTLRPEMTPTVARMVAGKIHDLAFPLRWYSIPNLFRYEKPQRGRLREHWQLNVDLFGATGNDADAELITVSSSIMKAFGLTDKDFVIKINNRKLLGDLYQHFEISDDDSYKLSRVLDKKDKISHDAFIDACKVIMGSKTESFADAVSSPEKLLQTLGSENLYVKEIVDLIEKLAESGITNIEFDPTLTRGFDYYTGIVFEVFDTHTDNTRSIFGGGRYDDLLDIFGTRKIPTIGFGVGDVTMHDVLQVHNLLPVFTPSSHVYIATLGGAYIPKASTLADALRKEGINVSVDFTDKKVGDQIKTAHKQMIPFVIAIGEDEVKSNLYVLKNMKTGEEKKGEVREIVSVIKGR